MTRVNRFVKTVARIEFSKIPYNEEDSSPLESAVEYYMRGSSKYHAGSLEKSAEDFRKAIELQPNYPEAHNDLGSVFYSMSQEEKNPKIAEGLLRNALACFNEVIKQKNDFAEAYFNRGLVYAELGQFGFDAVDNINRALELNKELGNDPDFYFHRANARMKERSKRASLKLIKKSKKQ